MLFSLSIGKKYTLIELGPKANQPLYKSHFPDKVSNIPNISRQDILIKMHLIHKKHNREKSSVNCVGHQYMAISLSFLLEPRELDYTMKYFYFKGLLRFFLFVRGDY